MITHNPSIIKNNSYIMNQAATTMFGFCASEDEAKMMNLSRGFTKAYMLDINTNIFYYKEIDSMGQTLVFKTYQYEEVIPPEPERPVTHDDLTEMENRIVNQILAKLSTPVQKGDDVCG